jgi:hypothetical protein
MKSARLRIALSIVLVLIHAQVLAQGLFDSDFELGHLCDWDLVVDGYESENTAFLLPEMTDCDATGVGFLGEIHDGAPEIDYFVYHFTDEPGCVVDPSVDLQSDWDCEICIFAECDLGTTMVTCPIGTPATSPLGRQGCCVTTDLSPILSIEIDCQGAPDSSGHIWTRVDTLEQQCVPYSAFAHALGF